MRKFIIIALLCIVLASARLGVGKVSHKDMNPHPVIGVFTEPTDIKEFPPRDYQFIAASQVKWLESAGARIVPIPYDSSEEVLEQLFSRISGLFFPGGAVDITVNATELGLLSRGKNSNKFTSSATFLLRKAMQANEKGDQFPIFATCLGFELLNYIVAGYQEVLSPVDHAYALSNVTIIDRDNSYIYSDLPDELFNYIQVNQSMNYNHHWAIYPETYQDIPALKNFFNITGISKDRNGRSFIASVQAKKYPFIANQYHPEKSSYEWKYVFNHDTEAIYIAQHFVNTFIQMSKRSKHIFTDQELIKWSVWNFPVLQLSSSSYSQIYIMKNSDFSQKWNLENIPADKFIQS